MASKGKEKTAAAASKGAGAAMSGYFRARPKQTTVSIDPLQTGKIEYKATGALKDSITIPIVCGAYKRTLVIHRPIGIVPEAGDDDWVVSDDTDIPILLTRKDNPYAAEDAERKARFWSAVLMKQDVLLRDEDGRTYYGRSLFDPEDVDFVYIDRNAVLDRARAHAKAERKRDAKASLDPLDYMDPFERKLEIRFRDWKSHPDLVKFVEEECPPTPYETVSGTDSAPRKQVPRPGLKGLTKERVIDYLYTGIFDGFGMAPPKEESKTEAELAHLQSVINSAPIPGAPKRRPGEEVKKEEIPPSKPKEVRLDKSFSDVLAGKEPPKVKPTRKKSTGAPGAPAAT